MFDELCNSVMLQTLDPRAYIRACLKNGVRPDTRQKNGLSDVLVSRNTYENLWGSSIVKWGLTRATCGITLDVIAPSSSTPYEGDIVFEVSLWSFCSPKYERSKPAEARDIENILNTIAKKNGLLDRKQLCILPGELALQLRVSVLFLSAAGSLAETAVLAAMSSLSNCRLPSTTSGLKLGPVTMPTEDLCVPLILRSTPVYLSVSSFDGQLLVDPSQQERNVADWVVSLAVDELGRISYLSQTCSSDSGITLDILKQAIELATAKAGAVGRLL